MPLSNRRTRATISFPRQQERLPNRRRDNAEKEKDLLLRNYDSKKVDALRKRNKYAPYDISEKINFLLQETGDFILLEDGSKIILE
jgi:hypothetical protein